MDPTGANFRAVNGNWGFMIRNDGSNTWFLMTASGDPWGQWRNDAHPFWINNDSRAVQFGVGVFAPYFQISSDIRLKNNLKPIEDSVDKLSKLTGYTYDFKDSDKRRAGLVAQDVEKVLPEAVGENTEGYKTIEYSSVTALLVNAVNALTKRVAELESKL